MRWKVLCSSETQEMNTYGSLPQDKSCLVVAPHQAHLPLPQEELHGISPNSGQFTVKACLLGLSGDVQGQQDAMTEPSLYLGKESCSVVCTETGVSSHT